MEDLGVSAEASFGEISTMMPESPSSCDVAKSEVQSSAHEACIRKIVPSYSLENMTDTISSPTTPCSCETVPRKRSENPLHFESFAKKLHVLHGQEEKQNDALEVTESTVLEWVGNQDGVSLVQFLQTGFFLIT